MFSKGWIKFIEKFTIPGKEMRRQRSPSDSPDHLDLLVKFYKVKN